MILRKLWNEFKRLQGKFSAWNKSLLCLLEKCFNSKSISAKRHLVSAIKFRHKTSYSSCYCSIIFTQEKISDNKFHSANYVEISFINRPMTRSQWWEMSFNLVEFCNRFNSRRQQCVPLGVSARQATWLIVTITALTTSSFNYIPRLLPFLRS